MKQNNTKQALWLGVGSLSSFLFTLGSSVLLARYFELKEYGTFKQVLYIYQTLLVVFTSGLPSAYAYFLSRSHESEAKSIITKFRKIFFILGGIFSLVLFLSSNYIASLLKNEDLSIAIKFFSPVPLLMLPTMGLESVLATFKKTQFAAIYAVLSRLLSFICVVAPVIIFKGGYISAIIGFVIASCFSFVLATYFLYFPTKSTPQKPSNLQNKQIINYIIPLFTASIWGVIISSSDQFFISRFFGNEMFGIFSNGALELPFVGMIVAATSTVMMPYFSKILYTNDIDIKNQILTAWNSMLEKTIKLTYPLLLFFLFFADYFILLLFGNKFIDSAIFFKIKIIGNFFTIVAFTSIIMAINGNKFYTKVHFFHSIFLIITQYLVLLIIDSPFSVMVISVLFRIINTLIFINYLMKYFKFKFTKFIPVKLIFKIILPSALFLFLLKHYFIDVLAISIIYKLLIGAILYFAFYTILIFIAKIDYYNIIKPLLNKRLQ